VLVVCYANQQDFNEIAEDGIARVVSEYITSQAAAKDQGVCNMKSWT
jgi:hypothetical protein